MTNQTPTVREFSPAGPCLTLGALVRVTPKFFVVRDRHDQLVRFGKGADDLRHTSPCPSCRDHAHSQYPNGYDN